MVLLVGALWARLGRVDVFEANVFRLVNDLPKALSPAFVGVMQLGSLVAVAVAALAAVAWRRFLMARDVAVAGALAWVLARFVKDLVGRGRPAVYLERVLTHGEAAQGLGYPSGHVAVAAAMATAAGPWLPRPVRRAAWAAVALVAVARVYVGAHLPLDVVGGAALGWALAAALHLLWGAPGGRPTLEQVRAALEQAGLALADVRPAVVDARGSTPFFATTADGHDLFAKVVGREQRDADALFKGWRHLAYKETEDEDPFASAKRQVEHEAYLALLAERAGVRTPSIVATADAGSGSVLLVQERIPGSTLDRVAAADVDDAWLEALWGQVATLRRAHIAHRDLRQANVLLDSETKAPWLIDFGFAEAAASERRLAQDVAELLASLSCLVGAERAVGSAVKVLGKEAVAAALPLAQPMALSTATRHDLRAHRGLLKELRDKGAAATGAEAPPLERLERVKPRNVVLLLVALFGIHLLLPQVGELHETLDAVRTARWEWLVVGLLLSGVTYVMAGLCVMGAVVPRLALGRTAAVQLASSFANRITPGNLGGLGINVRYLERAGVDGSSAVGAVALDSIAGGIVHLVGMIVAFALVGQSGLREVRLPRGWPVLVAVVVVLVALGVVLFTPLGRRRLLAPALRAAHNLGAVLRRPDKAVLLFGGSFGLTAAYALALAASLKAFGADVALTEVVAVYLGGAAVAAAAPTPGGLGAIEAALVAGLTALGAPHGPTIAGVLGFRLLTFWLPVLPGWLTLRVLRRRDII